MGEQVVVVAARDAWPEYQEHSAYICQPNRTFGAATRMAFYAEGAIQPLVPLMGTWFASLTFTYAAAESHRSAGDDRLGALIEELLRASPREKGEMFGVLFLSAPGDAETVVLPGPIVNDKRTATGKRVAWTRRQGYASLDALTSGVTRTSQL